MRATDVDYVGVATIVNPAKEEIDELPVPIETAHWTTSVLPVPEVNHRTARQMNNKAALLIWT